MKLRGERAVSPGAGRSKYEAGAFFFSCFSFSLFLCCIESHGQQAGQDDFGMYYLRCPPVFVVKPLAFFRLADPPSSLLPLLRPSSSSSLFLSLSLFSFPASLSTHTQHTDRRTNGTHGSIYSTCTDTHTHSHEQNTHLLFFLLLHSSILYDCIHFNIENIIPAFLLLLL